MKKCVLCGKKGRPGHGPFFQVPLDDRRKNMWMESCKMAFARNAVVCADHFVATDFLQGPKRTKLLPNAVPKINIHGPLSGAPMSSTLGVPELEFCSLVGQMQENTAVSQDPVSECDCYNDTGFESQLKENCDEPTAPQLDWEEVIVECKEISTQTEPIVNESIMVAEIASLRNHIKELRADKERLERKLQESNDILSTVRSIFTEGQVRKLSTPTQNIQWSWPDISNAICLHASGPRAYAHLYGKGFPYPHVSTLQRWYRKVDINEGVITTAIEFMRQVTELSHEDKVCVLAFDEMKVTEAYEYDQRADYVPKPSNYVQVVMARGLRKSWKQPIFYGFDTQMTKDILLSIISALHHAGFTVVAVVCDMGPTNRKLWRCLEVTPEKPWFPHPSSGTDRVFAFADAPHLLKLIRNHFLDTGLVWKGNILTSRTICDVLKHTSTSDASIIFKLSTDHLTVKGVGRQKVKLAAQVFSNTTANAIRRCYSLGLEVYMPTQTADMIQLINDWFDVLNSSVSTFGYPGKQPYGLELSRQDTIITQMNAFMSSTIIPNKRSLEVFQKGVLLSNAALVMLHKYVESRYNMQYIATNRLNQDVTEHFFGAIRSKGGLNDHPTRKEFQYRLRKYILARNTEHLRGTGNVVNDSTNWLGTSTQLAVGDRQATTVDGEMDFALHTEEEEDAEIITDFSSESLDDIGVLHEDALEYISGYIIRKLNLTEHESEDVTLTWVDQVSKGSLKKPSPQFLSAVKELEMVFYSVNALEISHEKHLLSRLLGKSERIDVPDNVKKFFFKCRTYFRLRHLNKRLKIMKAKQRIMGHKKLIKINL